VTETLRISRWFDRHLHIRDGDRLKLVLPETLKQHATGALIMGNLMAPSEPVRSIERAKGYRKEIEAALPPGSDFNPRLALYLTDQITPDEVVQGYRDGLWCAVKMYMADQNGEGGTTGSVHGVRNLKGRYPVFAAMEREGIPLLGHFEAVEADVDEFDREDVSRKRDLMPLVLEFLHLPIVVEHVTTLGMAHLVASNRHRLFATVTAHHLMLTRNDLFRGGLNPAHWCKPVAKREVHRAQIAEIVTGGSRFFGAGTDSAPHPRSKKELCHGCAAGIFTAPCAVELYATVFEQARALHELEGFLSVNMLELYGMKPSTEQMTLERVRWTPPEFVGDIPVFRGGQELTWKLRAD